MEDKSKSEITKKLTFRELLEKNTNLLTILGIFNGLALYAQSVDNGKNEDTLYIAFCFQVLSIIVLWYIISDFYVETFKPFIHYLFYILLLVCQFNFVLYIFSKYIKYLKIGLLLFLFVIYSKFIYKLNIFWLEKLNLKPQIALIVSGLVFFICIILSLFLSELSIKVFEYFFQLVK